MAFVAGISLGVRSPSKRAEGVLNSRIDENFLKRGELFLIWHYL
jgi:hypothetical protein